MDQTFPECDSLPPHKRAICRGETNHPLNGPHSRNSYRVHWGLAPVNGPDPLEAPKAKARTATRTPKAAKKPIRANTSIPMNPKLGRYPGTNLAMLLKQVGVNVKIGCDCEPWISKANQWGPEGCIEHRQEIIDRLADRAKTIGIVRKVGVGVMMIWNGMRPTIGDLVDMAIKAAQDASRES